MRSLASPFGTVLQRPSYDAETVNAKLSIMETTEEKVSYLKDVLRRTIDDAVFASDSEIIPIHSQNSIQTIASFVRRLDKGTVFACGMLFSLSLVTFFAARR